MAHPSPSNTATVSYWIDSAPLQRFPRLDRHLSTDVVIIGAGITGLTAAYLLKRAGRRVVVLERDRATFADTGHTSAHLTCVTDLRLRELVNTFGRDHAQAVWDAGAAAITQIEACVRDEAIDCDFEWVPGYLHVPLVIPTADRGAAIDSLREEAALARQLGFDAHYLDRIPFFDCPGVEFPDQARFHPRRYLAALAEAINRDGSHIFEHSAVDDVTDDPLSVSVGKHSIQCDYVIVATHNPIVGKAGLLGATLLQTKLALYTSYVIGGKVPSRTVPDGLFWDTGDPYHYIRIESQRGGDYVIVGGEDHKTGQEPHTDQCYARLELFAKSWIPNLEITHRWSGQVIETSDGLPFIGEMAPKQFAATGFSGNGMTFGTLGAMMAVDAATGRSNPWAQLFDIGRTRIKGGLWDYIKENKDYPYYLIRDRFRGAEARSVRAVRRGEGRLLSLNGKRAAAYRDDKGALTLLSPICTHMACLVEWNVAERTWDCPCHGSRFAPTGRVLSGPAESPLKPFDDAADEK